MLRCIPCFLLLATASVAAADVPQVVQRWALLVGVDDYAYAQKLNYCGADQRALRDRLVASGFPEDHVFLLEDQADDPRLRPSKGNIERHLELVINLADTEDLVVIAFSGHGVHLDEKSFLCPADCTLDDAGSLISVDGVYDRLKDCAAQFKLVLVDACRNDPRPGGTRSMKATAGTRALAESLQKLKLPEGVVLLNSCAPGEVSWEEADFGHGVFMHYVLDGLAGAADADGDGAVSLLELQTHAGGQTKTFVANRHRVAQRPFFKGDLSSEALTYALLPVPKLEPGARPPGAAKVTTNSIGMQLALIPAGEFMMGSPDGDPLAGDDEAPQHRVRITKPFLMGVHEVTRGQFAQFVQATNFRTEPERDGQGGWGYDAATNDFWGRYPQYTWRDPGFTQTDDHPVVNVTYGDAVAFCEWLSGVEGKTYRLPSEAEWEYACRAGTTTPFYNGDAEEGVPEIGNCADKSYNALKPGGEAHGHGVDDGFVFTSPVGRYRPNAFGLYDMIGNVWEWCDDYYDPEYYAQSRVDDPAGFAEGTLHVVRGASWYDYRHSLTSTNRAGSPAEYRDNNRGFRVATSP